MTLARSEFKRKAPSAEPKRRTRKCVVCRSVFEPRSMLHKACGPDCAEKHVEQEKARKERSDRQKGLQALKRRADYLKEAQIAFNAFIRERDKNQACISSGRPLQQEALGGGYDCGHYRSTGSAPHLRFDERNAHGQSKHDNRYLAGNAVEYRKGLINRYGLSFVESLESDNTPRKYTVEQLQQIKQHYRSKLKQLKEA